MTPLEMVWSSNWVVPIGSVLLIALLFRLRGWVNQYHQANQPARVDQRMTPEERALSIRDADDYFHGTGALRLQLHELRRQHQQSKSEGHAGESAGPLTTHRGSNEQSQQRI